MADSLTSGRYSITFEAGTTSDDADRLNKVEDLVSLGSTKFPPIGAELASGTGASQANKVWGKKLTITGSGGSATLNLFDGSLTNGRNQALALISISRLLIRVRSPAAGVKVVVGGAATPWAPWLSDVTKTEDVASVLFRESDISGWTVSNTAKLLAFTNPGTASINVDVAITGK